MSADQMLDKTFDLGECTVRGKDLKMAAAAFLYNVTGDTKYEDAMKTESDATGKTSTLDDVNKLNQLWGTAGYLFTPQTVHYPDVAANMKASIIAEAKSEEAGYSATRPSRRSTDNSTGYFQTEQNVQRTLIAHAVDDNQTEKETFYKALELEADWSLGRNPLNMIQMTTASTSLQSKRSVENMYTSGRDDGTPGLHPGHTPYMNVDDWDNSMVMGSPSWLCKKGYPAQFDSWPKAEAYFNTRYVWAHSEFTPQQTMRGKTALYGYLYGIGKHHSGTVRQTIGMQSRDQARTIQLTIGNATMKVPEGNDCRVRVLDCSGKVAWTGVHTLTKSTKLPALVAGKSGVLLLDIRYGDAKNFRTMSIHLK